MPRNSGLFGFSIVILFIAAILEANPPLVCAPPCLYFSNRTAIGAIEYQTGTRSTVVPTAGLAIALDVDVDDNLLFWSDSVLHSISRINLTDGRIDKIVEDRLGVVDGLAVEWYGNFLYWTDCLYSRVEMARLDGTERRILFSTGVDKPKGIAVDPRYGYMFWTDCGSQPKIERATLSGQGRTTIIDSTMINMYWPNDIVIDFSRDMIYWVDAEIDIIGIADFDGNNRNILSFAQDIHPFSIAIYPPVLFWSDWHSVGTIRRINKEQLVYLSQYDNLGTNEVMGIAMFDASRQPAGSQVCSSNNGGCSNLCIIEPADHSCACPNGLLLGSDGKTCKQDFTRFALFVDRESVNEKLFQLSLDVSFSLDKPLLISPNAHRPIAMDFDPEEERIYWADLQLPRIFRAFLNGCSQEVVIGSGLVSPAGIAVDPVGRNIYWTDLGNRNLEVAKLNGANRTVLAYGSQPMDILLDTDKGAMYWTDRGSVPVIEQANMDGTNRKVLVKYGMYLPNSLALDKLNNRLYWIDSGKAAVEYIQLNQGNTRVMFLQNNRTISHPFGLTMLDNYLYFTDWFQKAIVRVNMTSKHQEVILRGLAKPGDIRAFRRSSLVTPRTFTTCSSTKGSTTPLILETSVPILFTSTHALKSTVTTPNLKPPYSSSPDHRIATSIAPVATSTAILLVRSSAVKSVTEPSSKGPTDRHSTAPPSATTLPPNTACSSSPCQNGTCIPIDDGTQFRCDCKEGFGSERCSVFIGNNAVNVTIEMALQQWDEAHFQASIVKALKEHCKENDCRHFEDTNDRTYLKRSNSDATFTLKDVIIVLPPKKLQQMLLVGFAVVDLQSTETGRKAIPAGFISNFLEQKADDIGRYLGGYKVGIFRTTVNPPTESRGGNTRRRPGQSGKIAGAAVGGVIGLVFFIIMGVWFWRRRNCPPDPLAQNHTQKFGPGQTAGSSFENPTFYNDLNGAALDGCNHVGHDQAANVTVNPIYGPETFPSTPQQDAINNSSLYYSCVSIVGERANYQKITGYTPHEYQELNAFNLDTERLKNKERNS